MDDPVVRLLVCGSVDDGKSTLIGRLLFDTGQVLDDHLDALEVDSRTHGTTGDRLDLALLTDGLTAEREQGITIDVAWRVLQTSARRILIADTPGHVQHTRNMATGASACDAAVVLVDAAQGVLLQTRSHVAIATLLGIRRIVFAINKLDLVADAPGVFAAVASDCQGLLAPDIHGAAVPVIARDGDNVVQASDRLAWWSGRTLLGTIEGLSTNEGTRRSERSFRFPVQLVQRPDATFRGYAGSVAAGTVRVGQRIRSLPSGATSTVARIVTFDGDRESATAGEAVTITLAEEIDVARGDLFVHADAAPGTLPLIAREIDATLVWLDHQPLSAIRGLQLRSRTGAAMVSIRDIVGEVDVATQEMRPAADVTLNAVVRVTLEVERDHVFDPYDRERPTGSFVLVDRSTQAVVAAGMANGAASPWDRQIAGGLTRQRSDVRAGQRQVRFGHAAVTVIITGRTGAGKSTLARVLERRLFDRGAVVVRLDGEDLRLGISRGLGFGPSERAENLRRAAETASLLNDHGQIVLLAVQAPAHDVRARMGETIGVERTIHVHLEAPEAVRRARDPEAVRMEGEAAGVYDEPVVADLVLDTSRTCIDEAVGRVVALLLERRVLDVAPAVTVWFTGLSGAGKSTIARALVSEIGSTERRVRLLDGDELRRSVSADLGFSVEDRSEQITRVGALARAEIAAGATCVVALISPIRAAREAVRAAHPPGTFLEVHVATPLDVCEARDPKGLYRRARAGELAQFTGIDSPYEPPLRPDVVIEPSQSVPEAVRLIMQRLGWYVSERSPAEQADGSSGHRS